MSTLPENITLINQIKNISKEWITVSFVNSETGSIEPHQEAVFRVKNENKGFQSEDLSINLYQWYFTYLKNKIKPYVFTDLNFALLKNA
tara:strand:- start:939 stop:1205 length:267 start_codon:yes stop_codon:yes gene_type:complete